MKKVVISLIAVSLAGITQAADVTGTVTLNGTPPPEKTIEYEANCAAQHPTATTTRHYVVGADHGLGDVFVYVSKGLEGKKFTPPTTPAVITQQGCFYHPYVLGVMVGQPVEFKNEDPLMHNVHGLPTTDGNQEFNFAEVSQGDVNDTKWVQSITKPEVFVKVKCDVHPWMFAYVGVVDNPYYAVTDKDGHFKIENLPPGTYTLTAAHVKCGNKTQEITVAEAPVTANFTFDAPAAR